MQAELKISTVQFNRLCKQMEVISKNSEAANLISEEEAALLLGMEAKSFRTNYVQKGKCEGMYVVSPVNNSRHYYRDKILGLVK